MRVCCSRCGETLTETETETCRYCISFRAFVPTKQEPPDTPDTVRIGYADYSLEQWDGVEAARSGQYGECDHQRLHIRVSESLPPPLAAAITIHEVLHGIVSHFNVPCANQEEEIVAAMAEGLAQVFRDNEHLIDWLQEQLKPKENQDVRG